MKNTVKWISLLAIALCGCAIRPPAARAQFIGFTSPQTVQQTLATNTACTGAAQTFQVANLGQTQHTFTILSNILVTHLQATVYGVDTAGNLSQISDSGFYVHSSTTPIILQAAGYSPIVEIKVTCDPATTGTFSISYSGASSTQFVNAGGQLQTQVYKPIIQGGGAGTSVNYSFSTPFGNLASVITFNYTTGAGPANSTIGVLCVGTTASLAVAGSPFALVTTAAQRQSFYLPAMSCPEESITYTAGAANANQYDLTQEFIVPGMVNPTLGIYSHITGTTATALKNGGGVIVGINVNTSAAGTVSIFDLPAASCTATPSTNVVAVLTIGATEIARSIPFNTGLVNGICVKASVAMDLTVEFQ